MLFPNGFSVTLVKPGTQSAFVEVEKEGTQYVVAVPGHPYEVSVGIPAHVARQHEIVLVQLRLDGNCPGMSQVLCASSLQAKFQVWLYLQHTLVKEFQFCTAPKTTGLYGCLEQQP